MSFLSNAQIAQGTATLENNKLSESQVDDLESIFRGFLKEYADDYPQMRSTLESLEALTAQSKAAKLAYCLLAWQENGFDNGGFAATNANRSGFNYSIDTANYKIFEYAFGLLWKVPSGLKDGTAISSRTSSEGFFRRIY